MIFNISKKFFTSFIFILLALALVVCEKQLPQELQKKNNYPISDFDGSACSFLSRDTTRTDTVVVGIDTTFITNRFYIPVTTVHLETSIENSWTNASDSIIQALYDIVITDTTMLLKNPTESDTAFVYYQEQSGSSNETVFFISWDLTEQNSDAYIEIDIFNKSGEKVQEQSNSMDLETIAGCTQAIEVGGQEVVLPKIRSRKSYELPEGQYLIRFYISEPTTVGTFRLVVLQN
ncbi:hypothetical protein H8E88_08140 [candidate division KSB1 bacterium]|nr:hypothetical protein [candidate division KSB1 bacterium]